MLSFSQACIVWQLAQEALSGDTDSDAARVADDVTSIVYANAYVPDDGPSDATMSAEDQLAFARYVDSALRTAGDEPLPKPAPTL